MELTGVTALVGAIVGTAGFVLGVMNYLRDRPRIMVRLQWDMAVTDNPTYDPNKKWALVEVANAGRRPIYISHASLRLPKGYDHTHIVIIKAIRGQRLSEGDSPVVYVASQDGLEQYAKDWHKIRAVVFDSTGKEYVSLGVDKSNRPSWAQE